MKKVLVAVLVLLLLAALAGWLLLDSAVAKSVEKGGTYALEVPTTVGGASLQPFAGEIGLDELVVANPAGFSSPHFLRLARAEASADTGTLFSDEIHVRAIGLAGLDVHLERAKGGTNAGKILDSLKRFESKSEGEKAPEGEGKKLVIGELVLRDITVHSHLVPELGETADATLRIPEIRLTNLGGDGGITTAELIAKVVETVLASTLEHGGGVLSGEVLKDLKGSLENLGGDALEEIQEKLGAGKELEKVLEKGAGELEKIFR